MSLQPPDMFLQWVSYHIHIACLWCEFHIRRWGGWKVKFNPITRINVGKTCFFEATDKLKCHGSFFCNPTFFFNCQFKYFCLSLFFFLKKVWKRSCFGLKVPVFGHMADVLRSQKKTPIHVTTHMVGLIPRPHWKHWVLSQQFHLLMARLPL